MYWCKFSLDSQAQQLSGCVFNLLWIAYKWMLQYVVCVHLTVISVCPVSVLSLRLPPPPPLWIFKKSYVYICRSKWAIYIYIHCHSTNINSAVVYMYSSLVFYPFLVACMGQDMPPPLSLSLSVSLTQSIKKVQFILLCNKLLAKMVMIWLRCFVVVWGNKTVLFVFSLVDKTQIRHHFIQGFFCF